MRYFLICISIFPEVGNQSSLKKGGDTNKKRSRVAEIIETIVRHIYVAGQFKYPYNRSAEHLASKSFHLARACDLTDRLIDKFGSSVTRKILSKSFKKFGVVVVSYEHNDDWGDNEPKSSALLVNILMGDICHQEITESFMKNFSTRECPKILTKISRAEARHCLNWLSSLITSTGTDSSFLTRDL